MKNLKKHIIRGIHVTDRITNVVKLQEFFSQYGCHIKTRIGLHDVTDDFCSPNGLILLELLDHPAAVNEMIAQLKELNGIEVQQMVFDHP